MPIPAMWTEQNELEVGDVVAPCPHCGAQSLRTATVAYSCVVWLFFFGFVKRLELLGSCATCNQRVRVAQADVPEAVRRQVPFLHRLGCATIAVVGLLFAVVMAIINN